MISRDELVDFANENGLEVTEWQIIDWHQHGIVPAPVRSDTGGKSGSVWLYPDSTKDTLLVALRSTERDTLDGLLLDVWLSGGDVNVEKVRKVLLNLANPIERFVRNAKTAIDKFSSWFEKASKARRLSGPLTDTQSCLTTMNVAINALSPHEDDVIWGSDIPGDPDESAAAVAERLFGADELRALYPVAYGETPEQWLDEMKQKLNARLLVETIKQASPADFERIRPWVLIMESWIDGLSELISIMPGKGSGFWLIKALRVPKRVLRILCSISVLAFQRDEGGRQSVIDAVEAWSPHLERLDVMKQYIQHMKKHPKMVRRKH